MERWTRAVAVRLVARAKTDAEHRSLLQKCRGEEVGYLEVLGQLSGEDRRKVDDYVAACEELIYREVQLAYELGTVHTVCSPEA